jgi:hypothetical protein
MIEKIMGDANILAQYGESYWWFTKKYVAFMEGDSSTEPPHDEERKE